MRKWGKKRREREREKEKKKRKAYGEWYPLVFHDFLDSVTILWKFVWFTKENFKELNFVHHTTT